MKKVLVELISFFFVFSLFFFSTCKTNDPEPTGGWTDAEKKSYEEVIDVQDQVADDLVSWFQTMDSLDALDQAQQAFVNSANVSLATINNSGIAVQYTNGMRGGLFLKGKGLSYKKSSDLALTSDEFNSETDHKSLVNNRKMLQMDAAYSEFSYYTDQVHDKHVRNLNKVGISVTELLKDSQVTLDRLTQLSGYGIIDISSHGIAWPKETNITDVYYMTGETISANSTRKYWDDLTTGNIPVMKLFGSDNTTKYYVSPDFIRNHNDFSNDTVLFFGGFCYSFLGGWPDVIDDFGDGAYLGFTWSVEGFHCANWDVNSISMMSDTTKEVPMTLEAWMNDPTVDKSYWDEADKKTVSIHYAGDGNLKLWEEISISLVPLSSDGAPVHNPGEANQTYQFKVTAVTNISPLEYVWDIGDGTAPATTQGNVVDITWGENGNYTLKVDVKNKNTGGVLGSASVNVQIGNTEGLAEYLQTCVSFVFNLSPGDAIEGRDSWMYLSAGDIQWSGLSFSGSSSGDYGEYETSVSGYVSADGLILNATITDYSTSMFSDDEHNIVLTISDLPLSGFTPPNENQNGMAGYYVSFPSPTQYITGLSGYIKKDGNTNDLSLGDLNWGMVDQMYVILSR